jgi:hypothetical protein
MRSLSTEDWKASLNLYYFIIVHLMHWLYLHPSPLQYSLRVISHERIHIQHYWSLHFQNLTTQRHWALEGGETGPSIVSSHCHSRKSHDPYSWNHRYPRWIHWIALTGLHLSRPAQLFPCCPCHWWELKGGAGDDSIFVIDNRDVELLSYRKGHGYEHECSSINAKGLVSSRRPKWYLTIEHSHGWPVR